MKSSSIHRLNADHKLSSWGRRMWYSLNWLNNSISPNTKSKRLKLKSFKPELSEKTWAAIEPKSSPSRVLSDLFWMQLPWPRIQSELGEVHILDTGAGSGRYGEALQTYSGGRVTSYTGLDESPHPDWPARMQRNPFIRLQAADSANFAELIPPNINLFISQSAIEHFPEDLSYFRQIREYVAKRSDPILQIHLFPSAACLRLYRFHGIRQYTPRTVSMIAALFPDSTSTLFALGNSKCNKLHFEYITKPVLLQGKADRRETETAQYSKLLRETISANVDSEPSFYALIIHSRAKAGLFDA